MLATCQDVYDGKFNKPVFSYRYGAVDPDFPEECADADASVSGVTFYTGACRGRVYSMRWMCGGRLTDRSHDTTPKPNTQTGAKLPAKYQNKMFWVDYSKKCGFWFDQVRPPPSVLPVSIHTTNPPLTKPFNPKHATKQGADGNPDFSHAHAFMTTSGAQAGGVTDVKTGPDGYLYVVDYSGA